MTLLQEIEQKYPGLGVRDTIMEILRHEGYGFVEAKKAADETIEEFKASGKFKATYYVGYSNLAITIQRKRP